MSNSSKSGTVDNIDPEPPAVHPAGERLELEVAGQHLETSRFGPPDMPLRVVLLHEGLGSVAAWRDFPDRLARSLGEPVLAYSRAGYGRSSPTTAPRDARFMHHEARVVLPALLHALAVEQPILIGHSDGASIALIHAGVFRKAGRASGEGPTPAIGVAVMAPHLFVEEVTVREIDKLRRGFRNSGLVSGLARYHRDPVATFYSWADAWLSDSFRRWSIEAEVAAITCPLLAVQGEQDQYGTALQIERLAALARHARTLMLPDCRHSPHREQPERVLAALTGFVAGLAC